MSRDDSENLVNFEPHSIDSKSLRLQREIIALRKEISRVKKILEAAPLGEIRLDGKDSNQRDR